MRPAFLAKDRNVVEYARRIRDKVGGDEVLQIPSVAIALRDVNGRVLLARHSEHNEWLLPGGAIEPGEVPADAAAREMWEETGVEVRVTRLIGVFGGGDFIIHYRKGDRTSYVIVVFEAVAESERVNIDGSELLEVRWVSQADAERLQLARWVPEVLHAVFSERTGAAFRMPSWRHGEI
jgi:8-oxo-dGTP pyrophosphatase MutT (NUDIX family)